jgi:hypothetical protein
MDTIYCIATMAIEEGWVLGTIGILGSTVGTMAGAMWLFMVNRLRKQDAIIEGQQSQIDRISKGCGLPECLWKGR